MNDTLTTIKSNEDLNKKVVKTGWIFITVVQITTNFDVAYVIENFIM